MKQLWDTYTKEFYSAIKKRRILPIAIGLDGPGEHYAKFTNPVRERKIQYNFIHVESNKQTELTSKIETDS